MGEVVARNVVDRGVLDRDHALRQQLEQHSLPGKQPRERDDERRDADEGDEGALERADQRAGNDCERDAEQALHEIAARQRVAASRQLQLGGDHGRDAAHGSDREIDLPEQEHEDDAVRDRRGPGRLDDQVVEVAGADVGGVLEIEVERDDDDPDDDRAAAELAGTQVVPDSPREVGDRDRFGCDRRFGLDGHVVAGSASSGIPETLVGTPAVIAPTISCWVVFSRS